MGATEVKSQVKFFRCSCMNDSHLVKVDIQVWECLEHPLNCEPPEVVFGVKLNHYLSPWGRLREAWRYFALQQEPPGGAFDCAYLSSRDAEEMSQLLGEFAAYRKTWMANHPSVYLEGPI